MDKSNKKILFFGNPLVKKDNLIFRILPQLKIQFPDIEFIEVDPTEDLTQFGKNLVILDVGLGIKEVKLLNLQSEKDLNILAYSKVYSMHDFDLAYNLKLLKKLKFIDSAQILCIPMDMKEGEAVDGIEKVLREEFKEIER